MPVKSEPVPVESEQPQDKEKEAEPEEAAQEEVPKAQPKRRAKKAVIEAPEEPLPAEPEPVHEEPKPKALEEESKPRVAKPAKNDKVECADCGKKMNANTLRYKHVCKPPKSDEIQKEKPRKTRVSPRAYSPSSPRAKMLRYYQEARLAQQEQKRARYRSWLGN